MKKKTALMLVLALSMMVSAELREYQSPDVSVVGNTIKVNAYLEQVGYPGASAIIELQVRPHGLLPLFVGSQKTCDPQYPENVHRDFVLTSGEKEKIMLTSTVQDGKYDLYLITVSKCWIDPPQGNTALPPYYRGKMIKTVTIPSTGECSFEIDQIYAPSSVKVGEIFYVDVRTKVNLEQCWEGNWRGIFVRLLNGWGCRRTANGNDVGCSTDVSVDYRSGTRTFRFSGLSFNSPGYKTITAESAIDKAWASDETKDTKTKSITVKEEVECSYPKIWCVDLQGNKECMSCCSEGYATPDTCGGCCSGLGCQGPWGSRKCYPTEPECSYPKIWCVDLQGNKECMSCCSEGYATPDTCGGCCSGLGCQGPWGSRKCYPSITTTTTLPTTTTTIPPGICGNGICEPPAENGINCPSDCKLPWGPILIAIGAVIFIMGGYLYLRRR